MKTWSMMLFVMFLVLWFGPLGFFMAAGVTAFAAVSGVSLALGTQDDDTKRIASSGRKAIERKTRDWL